MDIDLFNKLYNIKLLKVSYEQFNEAYNIYYGVQKIDNENYERIFSTYVYLKDCGNKTNEEIIKLGLDNLLDSILDQFNYNNNFDNLINKNINI